MENEIENQIREQEEKIWAIINGATSNKQATLSAKALTKKNNCQNCRGCRGCNS